MESDSLCMQLFGGVYDMPRAAANEPAEGYWSDDTDRRRKRIMTVQPLVNYNMDDGWYLTSSPIITAEWSAKKGGDRWTVPLGAGVGRVFSIGEQPIEMRFIPYYNVARPENGARWTLLFRVTFLFPTGD